MALSGALEDNQVSSRIRGKGEVRAEGQAAEAPGILRVENRVGVGRTWELSYRCVTLEPWAQNRGWWTFFHAESYSWMLLDSPMPLVSDTVASLV